MARALSFILGALTLGLGAALLLLGGAPKEATGAISPTEIAADLDGRLREAAATVAARASTLAELPRIEAAVATDARTVRDLTQDELMLRPHPGEIIVIGQVPKGGAPLPLLTLSLKTPPPALEILPEALDAPPAARLRFSGGMVLVAQTQKVKPRSRGDELDGALLVAMQLDLAPIAARLDREGRGGKLILRDQTLQLGGRAIPIGATLAQSPLGSDVAAGATLVLEAAAAGKPAPSQAPLAAIALLLGLAGLIYAAFGFRAKTAPATEPAALAPAPASQVAMAAATSASLPTAGGPPSQLLPASGTGTTGLAAASPPPGATANRIGRYEILRALGSGGMADVYLARSTGEAGFEKLVALKVIQPEMARNTVVVEHFLDEARLAAQLSHPNIVQITDLGRAGDQYFIAMEYIEGADLDRLLVDCRARARQVPVDIALSIVRRICDGLHAAHTAVDPEGKPLDLVHRDVKAANVFIAKNGAVKVGDFGIAKAAPARMGRARTEIGQVKGTPDYMAPEHRMGHAVDRRADVYGVGAIAYEILTGIEVNLDFVALVQLGKEGWPHLAKPSQVRPELPAAIDAVIWKALAFEKEERYASCGALEADLQTIAKQVGIAEEKAIAQWVESTLQVERAASA